MYNKCYEKVVVKYFIYYILQEDPSPLLLKLLDYKDKTEWPKSPLYGFHLVK